jgi:hypothetical protein
LPPEWIVAASVTLCIFPCVDQHRVTIDAERRAIVKVKRNKLPPKKAAAGIGNRGVDSAERRVGGGV